MASQPPSAQNYIGCRISLVSKSDIRYEGTLIDLNEGSISLGGVRSFGTEDRRADTFVAPRNDVYEFVVFKTQDIKDLFVSSAPRQHEMGSDPAILEVKGSVNTANMPSAVPSQVAYAGMPQSSLMGYPPPAAAPPVSNNTPLSLPPMGMSAPPPLPHAQPHYNPAPAAADLNRAALPAASSTAAQAKEAMYSDPFALNPQTYLALNQQRRQQEEQQRETAYQGETRTFERGRGGYENRRGGHMGYNGRGGGQMPGYGRGGGPGGVRGAYGGGGYENRGGRGGYGQRGGYQQGGLRNDYQSVQISGQQAAPVHRAAPPAQAAGVPRNLPEFDFASANMAFQEIEERMRHVNVHDHAEANEADEHQPEEEQVQDENKEVEPGKGTYDPAKSFFDNISCDALEKSKGPNNRPDWRRERQTNVETFGLTGPNSRVYENQNRGRGGYGSRGGGGYYRGGYGGGYGGGDGGYGSRGGYGYQYQRGRGGPGQRYNNGYQARGGGAYSQA